MSDLTEAEQKRVRIAIRFLKVRVGNGKSLARMLKMHRWALSHVDVRTVTASLAFRVARLAGVGVDDLLKGKYPPRGTCQYCGHHKDDAETAARQLDNVPGN